MAVGTRKEIRSEERSENLSRPRSIDVELDDDGWRCLRAVFPRQELQLPEGKMHLSGDPDLAVLIDIKPQGENEWRTFRVRSESFPVQAQRRAPVIDETREAYLSQLLTSAFASLSQAEMKPIEPALTREDFFGERLSGKAQRSGVFPANTLKTADDLIGILQKLGKEDSPRSFFHFKRCAEALANADVCRLSYLDRVDAYEKYMSSERNQTSRTRAWITAFADSYLTAAGILDSQRALVEWTYFRCAGGVFSKREWETVRDTSPLLKVFSSHDLNNSVFPTIISIGTWLSGTEAREHLPALSEELRQSFSSGYDATMLASAWLYETLSTPAGIEQYLALCTRYQSVSIGALTHSMRVHKNVGSDPYLTAFLAAEEHGENVIMSSARETAAKLTAMGPGSEFLSRWLRRAFPMSAADC